MLLQGIINKIPLEDPILDDAGLFSDTSEINNLKILPRTFNESLSYLKKNKLFKKYLGDIIYNEFLKIKETELRQYDTTVHTWERDRYFDIF